MQRPSGVRRAPEQGTAWILACAGMTTTLRTPYVDILEYITRSSKHRASEGYRNLTAKCRT